MRPFALKKVTVAVLVTFSTVSALAADLTINSGESYTNSVTDASYGKLIINGSYTNDGTAKADTVVVSDTDEKKGSFNNSGVFSANDFIVNAGSFVNTGTIHVNTLSLGTWSQLGGTINASESLTLNLQGYNKTVDDSLVLNAPILNIVDSGPQAGVVFSEQSQIENVQEITVTSLGHKTALIVDAGSNLTFSTVHLNHESTDEDARVEIYATGHAYIKNLSVTGTKGMIQTNAGAVAKIDNIILDENSILNLQTNGSTDGVTDIANSTGTFELSNIYVKENADFRISVYNGVPDAKVSANQLTINLESGAIADFGGWKEDGNTDWDPTRISLTADTITVNVLDTSGDLPVVYLSGEKGNVNVGSLSVISVGSNNTGNAIQDLEKLVNIVKTNTKNDEGNISNNLTSQTIENITLTQVASDIFDGATTTVDETGNITTITTTGNVNIDGIAGVASTGFLLWRDEMNSLNRRLDDLRDSNAHSNGLWARAYNSRSEFGARNITSKYTAIQIGYDRQIANQFWLGGAFSYTDGDHEVVQGSADNSLAALTLYGSWLHESGLFIDVTGKYGRIDNEFDIALGSDLGVSAGDYDTNAWGVSVQAGWRWQPSQFFIEPQVELMYGRMSSVDYKTSTGIRVDHDNVDSLIGRLGLRLGLDYPDNLGRLYLRASVLHDWEGEAKYTFTKDAVCRYLKDDLSGTWYEVGVGANFNASENLHFIADLQTSHGGEVDTDYRVNFVARYSF